MRTYAFTDTVRASLYEQLYHNIKNDIQTGTLKPLEKLPSKRSFARHLNLSTITIENAYAQLQAEGYIYSLPKKGYFVSDIAELNTLQSSAELQPAQGNHFAPSAQTSCAAKPFRMDFTSNQTSASRFPFATWAKLLREIMSEKSTELMTNPPSGGIRELQEAIAGYLQQFRAIDVLPEQIIIGAGTEYLYGLLIQLFGRDKIYAIENPGYTKISKIYAMHQVQQRFIPMDAHGISMEHLIESDSDVLHISPAHHFPTGIVTPISRRNELLNWAMAAEGRYIIEDDYDCEFRLMGKPIRALQSMDYMEKVIYMNTFTKSLASTIRISYMVLPTHLLERFYARMGFYSATVSTFEQYTLAKFIRDGYFEKHINRMRKFYRNQRDILLSCLRNSRISDQVTLAEEDSGLHFLMHVKSHLSETELRSRAAAQNIKIAFLSDYYYDNCPENQPIFLINYSCLEPEQIPDAVELLERLLLSDDALYSTVHSENRLQHDEISRHSF